MEINDYWIRVEKIDMPHLSLNMTFSFDASTQGIKYHKSNSGVDEDEARGRQGEPTTNVNRSSRERELGCFAACVWNNVEV